jgi:putative transposase
MTNEIEESDGGTRVRRSRETWQRLVDEHAASGQTQRAFCAERGISLASFGNWKRRLAAEAGRDDPWVEVLELTKPHTGGWDLELDLGAGVCLRLRRC